MHQKSDGGINQMPQNECSKTHTATTPKWLLVSGSTQSVSVKKRAMHPTNTHVKKRAMHPTNTQAVRGKGQGRS